MLLSMLGSAHQDHLRALIPEGNTFLNYDFAKYAETFFRWLLPLFSKT